GKLLGEGSNKKVYVCLRLEGDVIAKRAEVRISAKGEREAKAALDEDLLADEFPSPHIVDVSEDLIIYEGKKFAHKLRFIQPLMIDGYQFIDEKHSFDERLKMIEGAARGLKCMHDKGYLHRDVKPHNIFIDDKGCTKLADLGLAISCDEKVLPGGTPEFLPIAWDPDGSGFLTEKQTFKTDIFSLGITIEEIMNGQRSSDIAKLVLYMTHYDPKKRPRIGKVINIIEGLRKGEKPDWKMISV
ncbi:MAG: hypothetical protein K1000chlam4_01098, partial [Chlamydiae bacterium]|nr:hypothetical protein [Chlamydiota bacterium]